MKRLSRGAIASLVALLGVAALSTTAFAHKQSYSSTITLSLAKVPKADVASGQVGSSRGSCREKRTVTLFEDKDPAVGGDAVQIGTVSSTDTGAWSIPIQSGIKAGRVYYAQVKTRRVVNNRKHKHICKFKRSADVLGT